jgi:zinc finger protein
MAFSCGSCGYRNSEVKGGGAVPELGTEVKLDVLTTDDLKR